jgi:PmbA protein
VSVRKGELENVERNRDKSLGVTVYIGHRRGNASTSDFSKAAIEQTVQAAYDIARFTAEDPVAGLPDADDIAPPSNRDLDLFHPWAITSEAGGHPRQGLRGGGAQDHRRITNSEGAGVSAQQSHFFSAHTRGFRGGYASSRHSISVAPIAGKGDDMQRDAWYSSMRSAAELASPEAVGRYAAERALSRLGSARSPPRSARCCSNRPGRGPAGRLCAGHQRRLAVPQEQLLARLAGQAWCFPKHIDITGRPASARQGQLAV